MAREPGDGVELPPDTAVRSYIDNVLTFKPDEKALPHRPEDSP